CSLLDLHPFPTRRSSDLELDRFAVECVDDPWRNGTSRPVADECRENLCVVLRTVFRTSVHRHRFGVACTICSSPATSCSRGGARTMNFLKWFASSSDFIDR